MNGRFSFGLTVVLMLVILGVVGYFSVAISIYLHLPDGVSSLIGLFLVWLALEFAGQYGPRSFKGPLTGIFSEIETTRDRIVLLSGWIVGLVIIYLPVGMRRNSDWPRTSLLVTVVLGTLVMYGIWFSFGTKKLRKIVTSMKKTRPETPEET